MILENWKTLGRSESGQSNPLLDQCADCAIPISLTTTGFEKYLFKLQNKKLSAQVIYLSIYLFLP
jgi:hypothetical protein